MEVGSPSLRSFSRACAVCNAGGDHSWAKHTTTRCPTFPSPLTQRGTSSPRQCLTVPTSPFGPRWPNRGWGGGKGEGVRGRRQ